MLEWRYHDYGIQQQLQSLSFTCILHFLWSFENWVVWIVSLLSIDKYRSCKMLQCRVNMSQCRVKMLECRVKMLHCRVKMLQCRVKMLQCRVKMLQCRVKLLQCRVKMLQIWVNGNTLHFINLRCLQVISLLEKLNSHLHNFMLVMSLVQGNGAFHHRYMLWHVTFNIRCFPRSMNI